MLEFWKPATNLTCSKVDFSSHLPALGEIRTCIFLLSSCSGKKETNIHTTMRKRCERKFTPQQPPPLGLQASSLALQSFWESSCEKKSCRIGEGKDSRKIRWLVLIPCIWRSQILPKLYTTEAEVNGERMRSRQQSLRGTLHAPQSPQHAFPHLRSHRRSSSFDSGTERCVCTVLKMDENELQPPFMTTWMRKMITRQSRHDPWLIAIPPGHRGRPCVPFGRPRGHLGRMGCQKVRMGFLEIYEASTIENKKVSLLYMSQSTWL